MTAVFIHIPKTGGVSIQQALGLQQHRYRRKLVKGARYEGLVTFGHELLPNLIRGGYIGGDLFTFAFCRDPFDRTVSLWAHWQRDHAEPQLSFLQFCRRLDRMGWRTRTPQARWLDGVDLDFLGRYETLRADFVRLCDVLGVERRALPHLNMTPHRPWQTYYNDESADIVRRHFGRDFKRFGYADDYLSDG